MREVKRYVADDGKEFKSEAECQRHEVAVQVCRSVNRVRFGTSQDHLYASLIAAQEAGFAIVPASNLPAKEL